MLIPRWPVKASVPRVTGRLQADFVWFFLVVATHLRLTRRPLTSWVTLNLTLAGSLSKKEKVVPVGVYFLFFLSARRLPSRHLEFDWRAPETVGATLWVVNV